MLEVLAIRVVRSIRGLPDLGSTNWENSSRTWVISFPRSPQPMYMIMSASDHLAIWCWVMVFPVPKPPGMAAVPPFAKGNMVSRILWPVIRGTVGGNRFAVGLGTRMGHFWVMVISFSRAVGELKGQQPVADGVLSVRYHIQHNSLPHPGES